MAIKSAQLYNGDGVYVEKDSREITLTSEVKEKIDRIPMVVGLGEGSSEDALSAQAGKELLEKITNVSSMGKYLSSWDCSTGLPQTDPIDNPHIYKTGDYYIIAKVPTEGTKYKPDSRQYTKGVASTVVEDGNPSINDSYYYDGTAWILQPSGGRVITIDSELKTNSTNAIENGAVARALNTKANINSIPTKLSQLSNADTDFQSGAQVSSAISQATAAIPTKLSQLSNIETNFQNDVQVNTAITNATKNCVHKGDGLELLDNSTTKYQTEAQVQAAVATGFSDGIREGDSLSKLSNEETQYQTAAQVASSISIATTGLVKASELDANYPTLSEMNSAISNYHDTTKQDKLVSGTNIKTVNGESLLGTGNIVVEGIKVFELSSRTDLTGLQQVYNYMKNRNKGCVVSVAGNTRIYTVTSVSSSEMILSSASNGGTTSDGTPISMSITFIRATISSGTVTSAKTGDLYGYNQLVDKALPSSPNANTLYFITA